MFQFVTCSTAGLINTHHHHHHHHHQSLLAADSLRPLHLCPPHCQQTYANPVCWLIFMLIAVVADNMLCMALLNVHQNAQSVSSDFRST